MLVEVDSEQVEDFTLEEVRSRPDGHERIDTRVTARKSHLQPQVFLVRNGKQLVNNFKARLVRIPIHASDVGQGVVLELGVTLQSETCLAQGSAIDPNRKFVAVELRA